MIRDRVKELIRVKASELLPNPRNWRTHPREQQEALSGVLAEIGYADALLARRRTDGLLELIDGHLRAETTPDEEVPVLVLDLDEREADKLLLTLDPLAAMAGASQDELAQLLQEVDTQSEAVQSLLDGLADQHAIDLTEPEVDPLADPPEPQEDRADELRQLWGTEQGQLWAIPGKAGEHLVLCGNCRNEGDVSRLLSDQSVNVVFTSPPYASQREYDASSGFLPVPPEGYVDWWEPVQDGIYRHLSLDGSFFLNIKPACHHLGRLLYVFDLVLAHVRRWGWNYAEEFCWERSGIPQQVVRRFKNQFEPVYQFTLGEWKFRPEAVRHHSSAVPVALGEGDTNAAKRQGTGVSAVDGNPIEVGLAYPGNRLPTFSGSHTALGHSAAFPVGLPRFFIEAYSDPGDSVYDPFLGSGSTLIASEQVKRVCYGMEISPGYCAVALQRFKDAGLTPALRC